MNEFLDIVQKHERVWGEEQYHNRPDLATIISSEVVVFWLRGKEKKPYITIHNSIEEIEHYMTKLLFRSSVSAPNERIVRIFKQQKQMRIKNVSLELEEVIEES